VEGIGLKGCHVIPFPGLLFIPILPKALE